MTENIDTKSSLSTSLGQKLSGEHPPIKGKIIHVNDDGWGFISSPEIKFTRIFFHWTGLNQDTLNFQELKAGMKVGFKPINIPDKGWRAIKISILKEEDK